MKDSRGIGNRFENTICLHLSQWLAHEFMQGAKRINDLPFRRRTTSREPLEGHWDGKGDILWRPEVVCPFCFECKYGYDFDFDGLLTAPKWVAWSWWEQATRQASVTDAHPLLLIGKNRMPPLTFMFLETYVCLQLPARSDLTAVMIQHPKAQPNIVVAVPLLDLTKVPPGVVRNVGKLQLTSAATQ